MYIKYETETGRILEYVKLGDKPIADSSSTVMSWSGIEPSPPHKYVVIDGNVVSKSESAIRQQVLDSQWSWVRHQRDELLLKSDYTQLADSTHSGTKDEWATYRVALRNLTDQEDPDNIVWPTEPT